MPFGTTTSHAEIKKQLRFIFVNLLYYLNDMCVDSNVDTHMKFLLRICEIKTTATEQTKKKNRISFYVRFEMCVCVYIHIIFFYRNADLVRVAKILYGISSRTNNKCKSSSSSSFFCVIVGGIVVVIVRMQSNSR